MTALAVSGVVLGVIVVKLLEPTPLVSTATTPPSTSTSTPVPLAEPVKTAAEILDERVMTTASLCSQLVCTNLAEYPSAELNGAVDRVLAQYATTGLTGLSEEARVEMAHRVLVEALAKSCPEQIERVSSDLG